MEFNREKQFKMSKNCRISGYQKQKKKIRELEHDIKMMVLHPETDEGISIYMRWVNKLDKSNE